jgi:hypothetical protein
MHLPKITIAPNILEAAAIVALLFALLLLLSYMSRNFMEWSLSGAGIGLVVGFLLAIILEGFLIVGGRTVITGMLNWKNAPAPIQSALSVGHEKLLEALSVPASCSGIVK